MKEGITTESLPVQLAKKSLRHYLQTGKLLNTPAELPDALRGQAGVFVSLKKQGRLRGCIGTYLPTQENVAAEIIVNAVSAGTQDPRFWPVELDELEDLEVSVDVLNPPERIENINQLDPRRYGVIVRRGHRSGLLLPDLEGVDTPEQQVAIACQKAGIRQDEPFELYRFTVTRYR